MGNICRLHLCNDLPPRPGGPYPFSSSSRRCPVRTQLQTVELDFDSCKRINKNSTGGGGVDKRSETNSIEFKGNYLIIPFLLVTDNGDSFIEATENSFVGIFIGCIRVA